MPTTSSGSITAGTGKITYPNATDSTSIASSATNAAASIVSNILGVGGVNLGDGLGIYAGTSGSSALTFDFRTLIAGAGISIKSDAETLTITSTGTISSSLNELTGVLSVAKGGTGSQNFLTNALVVGQGTSALTTIPLPTAPGQYLSWNGSNYAWNAVSAGSGGTVTSVAVAPGASGVITVTGSPITSSGTITVDLNASALSINNLNGTLAVTKGGTGTTSLPARGILFGNGTGAVQSITAPVTAGQVLTYNGTTFTWTTPATVPANVLTSVVVNGDSVVNVTGGATSANSVAYTLATQPSGVTPGAYANANIQVDQYGRVTSASNGAVQASITAVNENNGGGARIFDDTTSTSTQFNFRRIQTGSSISVTENTGFVMLDLNTVSVAKGGTGATTLTSNGLLVGNGSGAVTTTPAPTSAGSALTWNGTGFSWATALTKVSVTGTNGVTVNQSVDAQNQPTFVLGYDSTQTSLNNLAGTLSVTKGGTGATSFAQNTVLIGNGTGTIGAVAAPTTANTTLVWNGTGFTWSAFPSGSISSFTVAGDSSVTVTNGTVTSSNSTVTVGVANSGVTNGTYTFPTITVDKTGRITAAANGTLPVASASNYTGGAAIYDNTVVGNTLNFRPLKAGSSAITVTQNPQDVTVDVGTVSVAQGGTGVTTLAQNGVVIGNGTSAVSTVAPSAAGTVLGWNGTQYGFVNAINAVTINATSPLSAISGTDANGQPTFALQLDQSQLNLGSIGGSLGVSKGGTGATSFDANELIVGTGTDTLSSIAAPTTANTFLTWDGNAYSWASASSAGGSGVTSVNVAGGTGITTSGGPVTSIGTITVSVNPADLDLNNFNGTLGVTKGGTGANTFVSNGVLIGNGTGALTTTAAPDAAGEVLFWDGSAFSWVPLSQSSGTGTVTSVAVVAGSNKLTVSGSPITDSGTITVDVNEANLRLANIGGTLPVTSGGTGLSTFGTAGQILAVNGTGDALVWQNANETGGTVTSVAVTGASGRVAVTGSPITSSGTINVDVVESGLDITKMSGTVPSSMGGTGLTTLGTAGQVLTVNPTANALIWKTPFSSVTAGSSKVTVSTTSGVATVDVDTTKMDVSTMTGVLPINHGGTGISALGTAGQLLAINQTGTGFTFVDAPSGTGGTGTGTVTSVAVQSTDSKLSVSGSPITSSGTISLTVNEANLNIGNMTGTLGTTHGGTGLTTIGTAKQILRVNSGATALEYAALAAADVSGLATVATSGSYADLTNKPTIPAAQVNSDWNASSGVAQILNKPTLAAVATSGAYSDLTGTPAAYTLPTASASTLGGIKVGTNLSIDVNGVLNAAGGTGTVTSVALAAGSTKVTVSGSPITSSGTLTVDVDTTKMDVSTMTGTLATTHGGTGLTTIGTAGQVLTVNSSGNGLTWQTPATGSGSGGTGPASSTAPGYYTFMVVLNAGGTGIASVSNLPSGWSAVIGTAGALTVTHTVGRPPYGVNTMASSSTSAGGQWNIMPLTYSLGAIAVPDNGSFSPSLTTFNCTLTATTTKSVSGAATIYVNVMF